MEQRCLDNKFAINCDGSECYDRKEWRIRSWQAYYQPVWKFDRGANDYKLDFPAEIFLCTYTRESNLFFDQSDWANAIVHETAHSCGWEHGMGMGVPMDKSGFNLESIANGKEGPPYAYWGSHLQ